MAQRAEFTVGAAKVVLLRGDITEQDTGAVVNAANSSLMGGGGVDGAIHAKGGPCILEECKQIVARRGALPAGEAVVTTGGALQARFVIHTVGPVWHGGGRGEEETLGKAYRSSLAAARERGLSGVSFPSISTGAYRFPVEKAAEIALAAVGKYLRVEGGPSEVRFVLWSEGDFSVYLAAARRLFKDS